VVDPTQLLSDTTQNIAVLLLPPILWLFLYRFIWEETAVARDVGFSRLAFWLLLLGGAVAVGTGANLPVLGYAGDLVAVNFGGALFPVLLSIYVLYRAFGRGSTDGRLPTALYLAGFVAASGVAFMEVLLGYWSQSGQILGVLSSVQPALPLLLPLTYAIPCLILVTAFGLPKDSASLLAGLRAGVALALTAVGSLATFFTTAATAAVGISSTFPLYLIAPVAVGVLAVLAMPWGFRLPIRFGLPVAFATSTFGVLIGADLFREPPLYSSSGLTYSVGGAGPLDLVALSGPLAMAAGYLVYRWILRAPALSDSPAPVAVREVVPPGRVLNRALDEYIQGRYPAAVGDAALASRTAVDQSRELLGLPALPASGNPWTGLPAPAWIASDQENLDSLSVAASADPRDGFRAVQTSRWLVRLARDLSVARFGSIARRTTAFVLDLAIVTAVGVAAFVGVIDWVGRSSVAQSVLFEAAVLGFASFGFVYFALSELFFLRTVGKAVVGLEVRTRELAPPGLLPALVRNVPKLVPLTVLAYGLAVATALFLGASILPSATGASPVTGALDLVGVIALVATVITIGLVGALSAVTIALSSERQRIGDLLAGTWVLSARGSAPRPLPAPVAVAAAPYG
jgi:uncharacterized RDD family membrane protein YckC/uncharacterized membrane protein